MAVNPLQAARGPEGRVPEDEELEDGSSFSGRATYGMLAVDSGSGADVSSTDTVSEHTDDAPLCVPTLSGVPLLL